MEPQRAAGWCNLGCLIFWQCFLLDVKQSSVSDILPQRHHFFPSPPVFTWMMSGCGRCHGPWEVLGSWWLNLTWIYWLLKAIHQCFLSTSQIFKSSASSLTLSLALFSPHISPFLQFQPLVTKRWPCPHCLYSSFCCWPSHWQLWAPFPYGFHHM